MDEPRREFRNVIRSDETESAVPVDEYLKLQRRFAHLFKDAAGAERLARQLGRSDHRPQAEAQVDPGEDVTGEVRAAFCRAWVDGHEVSAPIGDDPSTRSMVSEREIRLQWSASAKANTGEIAVPVDLPAGEYKLTVTAEDFAHNVGSQEVPVEILP